MLDSGPDGGFCPPVGDCRGFPGNCADLPAQFATIAVLPDYPQGLQDYMCHAFPDEEKTFDSFLVGLSASRVGLSCLAPRSDARASAVSIAVALPVTAFMAQCFGIANDNEAPESWLEWVGWPKFVFGFSAHRRWHYTGPLGQPRRYVRWYIRSVGAPLPETLLNLVEAARAWATGTDPEWTVEADEAEAEEATQDGDGSAAPEASDAGSAANSVASALELRKSKRRHMIVGLAGVYVTWAIFAWFIFVSHVLIVHACCAPADASCGPRRRSTGCSSTSCWATRRSRSLQGRGACRTA